MALTQSGAAVIPDYGDPRIAKLIVGGVSIAPGVLAGDVHTVMEYVASRWHREVEPLVSGQCWGYAKRDIRGGTGWSNHASGTAIDLNAVKHPQHTYTLTQAQISTCHAIAAACAGVIRWGGDFTGTSIDQQHWEIAPGMIGSSALAALAKRIGTHEAPRPEDDVTEDQLVAAILKVLRSPEGRLALGIGTWGYRNPANDPKTTPDAWGQLSQINANTRPKP